MMVSKIDRPNTTPTFRAICTLAVYFSVFRPFIRFSLVYGIERVVLFFGGDNRQPEIRLRSQAIVRWQILEVISLRDFRSYL